MANDLRKSLLSQAIRAVNGMEPANDMSVANIMEYSGHYQISAQVRSYKMRL